MNPLKPDPRLLVTLGSIVVHTEEMLDTKKGHVFDLETLQAMLNSKEIQEWLAEMNKMALIPVKR